MRWHQVRDVDRAMTDWMDFIEELDAWQAMERTATFWWRDDDSVKKDPAIDCLLALRRRLKVPIAVSAVPALTDSLFADSVLAESDVWVLQHGYAHHNHAPVGEKKCEFAGNRTKQAVCEELDAGARLLEDLFGARRLPVLVPPWNRIHEDWIRELPGLGYRGLSLFEPRSTAYATPGLRLVNTHVDIIDWRGSRGYVGLESALGQVMSHLRRRRHRDVDADEPTGLVTHHLVHDTHCWAFVEELVGRTVSHPAARWLNAAYLFACE
jgi:hypothetical protein